MNLSALKTFAPAVRLQLIEAVTRKLDFVLTGDTADLRAMSAQRDALRNQAAQDRKGLIERVAYTWFNRLTALRFIDARGWHPFAARVITAVSPEETQPELLRLVREGRLPAELAAHTDPSRLNRLLDGALPSTNPQGEVYRHLVLAACRFYHALLPDIFEKLNDETELLLPDDLLTEHSVVHGFRTEISDADCTEVEVLGWLYQFYISEKKDQVMARKSAVPTEDIPAVTQLFTPHWIVRYLVENSLGRLWLLNRPGSRLREHMRYFIEGEAETDFLKITKPEEIRLCDPAVGSGHMLTYAFDLLTLIYEEEGYAPTEIPGLILKHNLHGLEICPRAAQLAQLALVFKAREKSRRFLQPEHVVRPRIIELRDVRFAENELPDYIRALALGDLFNQPMLRLLHQFEEAKNFGSLIQPCLDGTGIAFTCRAIEAKDLGGQLFLRETHLKVLRVLKQGEALTQRYHVVVANPPFLTNSGLNARLKNFVNERLQQSKADLFSAFVERITKLLIEDGLMGVVTLQSWMFLSSFTEFREEVILKRRIYNLIHIGYNSFPELNSKVVQAVACVIGASRATNTHGVYINLNDAPQSADKEQVLLARIRDAEYYRVANAKFRCIPDSPIAYWASEAVRNMFTADGDNIGDRIDSEGKNVTGDNERFIRCLWEVSASKVGGENKKWFPIAMGGDYRKWFGNIQHGIDWSEPAREHYRSTPVGRIIRREYWYRPGITWGKVTTSAPNFRVLPSEATYQETAIMPKLPGDVDKLLGLLNSSVISHVLAMINPTINLQLRDIKLLKYSDDETMKRSGALVEELVAVARADWDNFETSWDFRYEPLLRPEIKGATLEASWRNWEVQTTAAIRRMQELETENNRLFIAAYDLDGELQPDVPEEQITLVREDARRDMAAFLSYGVGCMMGRYGLDHPGLILADAGDTLREFVAKVGRSQDKLTFAPDEDGIIPVLDGEWFEDDIVARTRDFLRATFGEATLNENVRFIEEALGKDLRKYFLSDFYKNHFSNERAYGYRKRPIYWLFRSPKGVFSALVYLHRMTRDTPNVLLNRYLRNYLQKLRARIEHLDHAQATAGTAREKTAARKESEQLKRNLRECEEWERDVLLPLAQSRPELDLDDGVKVNYLKFGAALAPIPGLAATEDE
jgi:hypothetical protein